MPVNNLIQLRKGSSSTWSSQNPVLSSGEPGYDLTNNILKVGDGVTPWNNLSGISPNLDTTLAAGSGIIFSYADSTLTISTSGGGGGLNNVVEDITPQLGGNLDLNSYSINGTGNISISGNIIANTGSYNALTVNSISVSVSGHNHTASDITNFNEAVDDRVGGSLMIEGTGVNLTYNDASGTLTIDNLHTEINILSQEPQGFVDRNDSVLSFNDSTRTFTIQPATSGGFYDVYIHGVKVSKTGVDSVVIGSGTALNYLHFDTNAPYSLQNKTTAFNFDTDVPIAYIHWNPDINQSTFFGEERHGIRMDSVTHKWIHNTFGIQYINGLSIGGYTLGGDGSSNSHAQIDISDGVLYQEDIIINITNGTGVGDFIQQLSPIAYIPTYYHSGSTGQWVRDIATTFPLKYNATRAQYNLYSPGPPPNWTTPNVGDKKYFAMWIVATNDINEPILAIVGQREDANIGAAQSNNTWSDINLTNIPASEIRPLYRLIFLTDNTFTNTPKSSLQSILDLRVVIQSTSIGVTQNDHGALFGLADDDHLQYVHINENRTISAAHTFSNGLYSSGLITSVSGNFTQNLQLNGTTVSVSGHTHTSSDITNFNTSVSGLLPTIANSGDNRVLTSTGSSVGINAESNLTFDGTLLSHRAGNFASVGDAQHSMLVARRTTTDATANVVLTLDGDTLGASNRLTIPAKTLWTFTIKLSAYNDTDNLGAWWIFRGGIRRNAANETVLISSVIVENGSEGGMSSTSASVVADDTNEALEIRVTGLVGKNIRWVGVLDISQVSY